MVRAGDRLVFWGGDTYTLDPNEVDRPAVKISDDSWIFVPSADPDRVWVEVRDKKASTPYDFVFDAVREIAADGTVTAEGPPFEGRWIDAAVSVGVVSETDDGLVVWDPTAREVVTGLRASGPTAATFGNTLVWCENHCPALHFSQVLTGEDRVIRPPEGFSFFDGWSGKFSPDGSTFAVPVSGDENFGPHGSHAVALVDVRSGNVSQLVPGSSTNAGCCQLSWDPTGSRLYIAAFDENHWTLEYWDVGSGGEVPVEVEIPHDFAMVAA